MRNWTDPVERWRPELRANWGERRFRLVQRTCVAPNDPTHLVAVQMIRERRPRRHGQEREESIESVRRLCDEVAVPAQHVLALIDRPEHRTGINGLDWVQVE